MTRESLQKEIVPILKNVKLLLLEWCTSLGKSKAAINIIKEYTNKDNKILLIVAELLHKKNWEEEFKKWGLDSSNITIICYASLKKYINTSWDLIICDEMHHLFSDNRVDSITSIQFNKMLGLSATINRENLYSFLNSIKLPITNVNIHKVSLKTAIQYGILPEPKIYLIPLELDNINMDHSIKFTRGRKPYKMSYTCNYGTHLKYYNKTYYPSIDLTVTCTARQKYNHLTKEVDKYKKSFESYSISFKNAWMNASIKRKRFLGDSKTSIVKEFIKSLKNIRYVCFCASIKQAEEFNSENSIHSKKKTSTEIVDKFNNKEIDSLFSVNMIQEGQNLVGIEAGIIVQLDGQDRAFVQKFGRSMRANEPTQYIFYYKNTRDEIYVENIFKNVQKEFITECPLEEVLEIINNN